VAHLLPRFLAEQVRTGLQEARIVAVVGARQVGKTSLVRAFENDQRPFFTLDDLGTLAQAQSDPAGFVAGLGDAAIIDEVQRAPDLLLAIKAAVDRDPAKGRFLLTGSADIMTLPTLADSLAGRMRILELWPLAEAEIERAPCNVVDHLFAPDRPWRSVASDPETLIQRLIRGGYPEAVLSVTDRAREGWFSGYLLAMIQRDIRDISKVSDVAAMGRLLSVLAARTARVVNFSSLSSESGIPKSTLIRYVDLLEQTYLIHRVPAWSRDFGRRLTKLPKVYLADVGVAAHEMHAGPERLSVDRNVLGGLIETFVVNELRKHLSWSEERVSISHYRESDGSQVDVVLESSSGARALVEVKASASPTRDDVRALLRLMDDKKFNAVRGILLHTGPSIIPIRENVHAVPLSVFWTPDPGDAEMMAMPPTS